MENFKILENYEEPNVNEFESFISHLKSHHSCRNMHLRKTRKKNKNTVLGHLHMVKYVSNTKSLGHIIGPDSLELVYELYNENGKVKLFVSRYSGDTKELNRVVKLLTKKLFQRAEQEINSKDEDEFFSNYKEGEFYLRRNKNGMHLNHKNIQNALKQGVINESFAKKIEEWGFELINP
ncbi:hypothetical protein [Halobacteriovorax sp.]|uniref:hypothetical protein n=1 Tax=Halobacteriovorax sp. TaxID=2020862 RepID=UPI003AF29BD0